MRPTLSRRLAGQARRVSFETLPPEAVEKVKTALLDYFSCAFESRDLGPSVQAIRLAERSPGDATVVGTGVRAAMGEAAFANAVLGHGLVREDMHTGSVSHLGVVIFPTLMAFAQIRGARGRDFITAAVCGYEVGAAIGRALMDREVVRKFRPTGVTGPLGAAIAGARLLALSEDATTSALGFAGNATSGLNEWPAQGADDMFFHVGFAARNAIRSVELAELGAYASETALEGPAGLFAALGRADRAGQVRAFSGSQWEILDVYHKPAPACNYAQTACQVARLIAAEEGVKSPEIAAVRVRASAAALNYPGCTATGPFARVLQAKMSIPYCVAATLARGVIEEANYRMLDDPELVRLIGVTTLEEGPEFTAAYPRLQGTEITVSLRNGKSVTRRLNDLVPATPAQVRERFRAAGRPVLGHATTQAVEAAVDILETQEDMSGFMKLLERTQGECASR